MGGTLQTFEKNEWSSRFLRVPLCLFSALLNCNASVTMELFRLLLEPSLIAIGYDTELRSDTQHLFTYIKTCLASTKKFNG